MDSLREDMLVQLNLIDRRIPISSSGMESLPDDILLDILVRLPAQDIHDSARHVCRRWYYMTRSSSFVQEHLHHSTSRVLLSCAMRRTIFLANLEDNIEISYLSHELERVLASYNGLVLTFDTSGGFCIVNPATNRYLALPPVHGSIPADAWGRRSSLAYVASSKEYKVVTTHHNRDTRESHCEILTVGIDNAWRHVHDQHLCAYAKAHFSFKPLVTGVFVHWAAFYYVVTLNVETEIIRAIRLPSPCKGTKQAYSKMGNKLSLLVENGRLSWDAWEMEPETGEWTKWLTICLEAQKCSLDQSFSRRDYSLEPFGWLKCREVLVFEVCFPPKDYVAGSHYVAYNVQTYKIHSFHLDHRPIGDAYFHEHVNSLLWLDNQ